MRSKKIQPYTDAQIRAMCDNRIYWQLQLRSAAAQRKLPVTSVTPLNDVVDALRASLPEAKP